MKQTLAIFFKDCRRFLPEILASVATVIALVLVYPHQWRAADGSTVFIASRSLLGSRDALGFVAACLVVLVPASWWILIARLVHGERLVGSTQFWLTRPYEWPKLLGAKALFIAVFVIAPFFVAQCVLLLEAGFNPSMYLLGLIYNTCLVIGVLILPVVALSVVTSTFGRITLLVMGFMLFIALAVFVSSLLPSAATGPLVGSLADKLSFGVLVCGCCAAVVIQYAHRKLRMAWLVITAITLSLVGLAFTDPEQALMGRHYPAPPSDAIAPAKIVYFTDVSHQPMANDTRDKNELEISIPLQATGVENGYVVIPVAIKAAIVSSGTTQWESPWNVIYNVRFLPGASESIVQFRIRRSVFERFKSSPVDLHLTFAIDRGRASHTENISLTSSEFSVQGFGICTPQSTRFLPAS